MVHQLRQLLRTKGEHSWKSYLKIDQGVQGKWICPQTQNQKIHEFLSLSLFFLVTLITILSLWMSLLCVQCFLSFI